MDLLPLGHELLHVPGEVVSLQFVTEEVRGEHVRHPRYLRHEAGHVDAVVVEIGGKVKVAAGGQIGEEEFDELPVDQPPFPVALLGPRVGAVDMNRGQGSRGDPFGDELPCLFTENPDIGHAMPLDPAAALVAPLVVVVDGDEIEAGLIFGGFHHEVAGAAADLQDERVGVAEHRMPLGRGRQIFSPEVERRVNMDDRLHRWASVR